MHAPGDPSPLGATVTADGVNFSVFSKHATGIELLLFDGVDAAFGNHDQRLRAYHDWGERLSAVRRPTVKGSNRETSS